MMKNVLVVDDSATMRKIIMSGSRVAGINVADCNEAGEGVEALPALAGGAFDVIFSDVNQPNVNGLAFAKEVPGTQASGIGPSLS